MEKYLQHHGILGMKWGIRRYQNPDGSLTAAGRKRYYKDIVDDVNNQLDATSNRANEIKSKGDAVVEMSNKLGHKYRETFDSFDVTNKFKKDMYETLKNNYNWRIEDEEDFKRALEEAVYNSVRYDTMIISGPLKDSRKKFDDLLDNYAKDLRDYTSSIIDKYKEVKIRDANKNWVGTSAYNEAELMVYNYLNTCAPAYLYNHFDDYEVFDTDEFYKMREKIIDGLSYNEYLKRMT